MSQEPNSKQSDSDRAETSATPTLVVVIEGGIVQAVVTDRRDAIHLDTLIIDYDTEGSDDDERYLVPQSDGSYSEALVRPEPVGTATIDIQGMVKKTAGE